jgi:hypothetical protein
LPVTKTAKVGVALAAIDAVTVGVGVAKHAPVDGLVSHSIRVIGRFAEPVRGWWLSAARRRQCFSRWDLCTASYLPGSQR